MLWYAIVGQYIGTQLSFKTFLELQWHFYSLAFFLSFAYILKHGIFEAWDQCAC